MKTFILLSLLLPISSWAWSNHGLSTYVALKNSSLQHEPKVKAEKLEDFLEKEKRSLPELFKKIETKIAEAGLLFTNTPQIFNPSLEGQALKESFLHSLRVNTQVPYSLYLQDIPSAGLDNKETMDPSQASLIKDISLARKHLLKLNDKEEVSPLLVVSTYVDEPDFGMDIGLFEDSVNSADGKIYGFGNLPFGNPRLEYATQAPFHMAFYFESGTTYAFKPEIKRTFPRVRIMMYCQLSHFAFKTGHPYWGYRFAAWALHYVQDLTQPYHTTLVPGSTEGGRILAAVLNILGFHDKQNGILNEITNLHVAVEHYQFTRLTQVLENNQADEILISPLQNPRVKLTKLQNSRQVKDVVAHTSNQESDKLSEALAEVISPQIYLSNDPGNIDYYNLIEGLPQDQKKALYNELGVLMSHLGQYSRDFIIGIKATDDCSQSK